MPSFICQLDISGQLVPLVSVVTGFLAIVLLQCFTSHRNICAGYRIQNVKFQFFPFQTSISKDLPSLEDNGSESSAETATWDSGNGGSVSDVQSPFGMPYDTGMIREIYKNILSVSISLISSEFISCNPLFCFMYLFKQIFFSTGRVRKVLIHLGARLLEQMDRIFLCYSV